MAFAEYAEYDGLGLAALVAKGQVTPLELAEEAIARVEKYNPRLNAVVYKMYDQARETAKRVAGQREGRFRGVPFLLKDILGNYAGVPTNSGARFLKDLPVVQDDTLVTRFKAAGLVAIGKTNVPEFGLLPTTEGVLYGACHNPWNLDHSTGGSSGGSAASVAAGIVPFAHANDGGGSIRIPASCCGLVGLKPSRARNPLGPMLGDILSGVLDFGSLTASTVMGGIDGGELRAIQCLLHLPLLRESLVGQVGLIGEISRHLVAGRGTDER
jgi:amidase